MFIQPLNQSHSDLLPNIHPGEILKEEFLDEYEVSAYKLAKAIHIPESRLSMIIKGKRSITLDTASRFSKFFGNSIEFWLNLQRAFELEELNRNPNPEIQEIEPFELA